MGAALRIGKRLAAWVALAGIVWLGGGAAAAATEASSRDAAVKAVEVAAGVYMVPGAAGEADAANLGRVGNAGFIVGDDGVLAIDTGTSYRHGLALLAAIREVTDKPVKLALITHTRQEFLFGAAAFREQAIPIHMHRQAAGLMQSRCERCLKTLQRELGEEAMRGTAMFTPDREFEQSHAIDLSGRPVRVLYYGHSSGPGDVAVFDLRSGVLFAGGLLDEWRVPDVQDSDLDGWAQALQALRQLPLSFVVPGHGPLASSATVIDAVESYLRQLRERVMALLRDGVALSEVADAAMLPRFAPWDQYETIHRRNAVVLYVRFEREQLFQQAGSRP